MGWKTTVSAVVSGMVAFITYVFPTEVGDFLNSIFPNAGYYIVRAVFAIAVCYIVALAAYEGYKRVKQRSTPNLEATVSIPDRERQDFRSGIATETYSILKKFTDPLNHYDINTPIWSGKAPDSRVALLGKEDYLVLRSFYDAIDERNRYFALRHGGFDLTQLNPLNQTCVETLSRAYGEVTWLKTESDTDSLLSRARKSVGLSESPLETINASLPQIMPEITVQSPELTIALADLKEDEKVREIELVLRDGHVIRREARFCYITVTNNGERPAEVFGRYDLLQDMIFVPLNKKPKFRVECKYDIEGFKHQVIDFGKPQAFVVALLNDDRWTARTELTIYPGPAGEAFVLLLTVKDFRLMTIPGGTRIYPNYHKGFPCKLTLHISLHGKDLLPYYYRATFEVTARNWKDVKVRQMGKTVRVPAS